MDDGYLNSNYFGDANFANNWYEKESNLLDELSVPILSNLEDVKNLLNEERIGLGDFSGDPIVRSEPNEFNNATLLSNVEGYSELWSDRDHDNNFMLGNGLEISPVQLQIGLPKTDRISKLLSTQSLGNQKII